MRSGAPYLHRNEPWNTQATANQLIQIPKRTRGRISEEKAGTKCSPQPQYTRLHGTSPTMQAAAQPPESQSFLAPKSPACVLKEPASTRA